MAKKYKTPKDLLIEQQILDHTERRKFLKKCFGKGYNADKDDGSEKQSKKSFSALKATIEELGHFIDILKQIKKV